MPLVLVSPLVVSPLVMSPPVVSLLLVSPFVVPLLLVSPLVMSLLLVSPLVVSLSLSVGPAVGLLTPESHCVLCLNLHGTLPPSDVLG